MAGVEQRATYPVAHAGGRRRLHPHRQPHPLRASLQRDRGRGADRRTRDRRPRLRLAPRRRLDHPGSHPHRGRPRLHRHGREHPQRRPIDRPDLQELPEPSGLLHVPVLHPVHADLRHHCLPGHHGRNLRPRRDDGARRGLRAGPVRGPAGWRRRNGLDVLHPSRPALRTVHLPIEDARMAGHRDLRAARLRRPLARQRAAADGRHDPPVPGFGQEYMVPHPDDLLPVCRDAAGLGAAATS